MNPDPKKFYGVEIRVNPHVKEGTILLIDRYGPKPVVYVPNEDTVNFLYRAIDADANFLKRCGVIVNIGDIGERQKED